VNAQEDPARPQTAHPRLRSIYYPYRIPFGAPEVFDYRERLAVARSIVDTTPDVTTKTRRRVV
jgi:hypothetical protein